MKELPVTVLMPVYNGEKYLEKAVESILSQTFRDFRFLIIDDGSSDGTPELLRFFQSSDSRIEVVRNESNMGLTRSLNKGLRISRGEFIARMDCDDVSLPGRFEAQVSFLKSNREAAMVGAAWKEMDATLERTLRVMRPPTQYRRIRRDILSHNLFCHSAVMIRRLPLVEIGGYNERDTYSQDYDLWLRLIASYQAANLGEIHHLRRIHGENLSARNIKQQLRTMARSQKRYIQTSCMAPVYKLYVGKSLFLSILPVWLLMLLSRWNRRRSPF